MAQCLRKDGQLGRGHRVVPISALEGFELERVARTSWDSLREVDTERLGSEHVSSRNNTEGQPEPALLTWRFRAVSQ